MCAVEEVGPDELAATADVLHTADGHRSALHPGGAAINCAEHNEFEGSTREQQVSRNPRHVRPKKVVTLALRSRLVRVEQQRARCGNGFPVRAGIGCSKKGSVGP